MPSPQLRLLLPYRLRVHRPYPSSPPHERIAASASQCVSSAYESVTTSEQFTTTTTTAA